VSGNRLYSLGATGIVNALDLATGRVLWSRNAGSDTGSEVPGWGFSGSPLVVGDLVVVAAAGNLVAYDTRTGAPRWKGPDGRSGYSSPHLVTIGGQPQVLLLNGAGAMSVSAADGSPLWTHPLPSGTRIVQPGQMPEGDLLLHDGDSSDLRRVAVARGASGWAVTERWKSNALKPYFSDFVVHGGHAYGFDGRFLACVDLADGARKWKGGRYGNGQLLLVADQDLLVVVTEDGELALVEAKPAGFSELARVPAVEGKTWNHPVLAGGVLLVRNDREMVAFQLGRGRTD
jgi:outer membrane protein assembly factor BamB